MLQKSFKDWARKTQIPQGEWYKLLPVWKAAIAWHRRHLKDGGK